MTAAAAFKHTSGRVVHAVEGTSLAVLLDATAGWERVTVPAEPKAAAKPSTARKRPSGD